jgi:hypothetical protein
MKPRTQGIDGMRVRDGLVVEGRDYYDWASIAAQLGLIESYMSGANARPSSRTGDTSASIQGNMIAGSPRTLLRPLLAATDQRRN